MMRWFVSTADRRATGLLALLAYVPILLTRPGRVSADTKSYLTIDPGRLLSDALTMWDPGVGAGTVPHQNIGYLFPLGPFYWILDRVGVPDWTAQRLLWGTLVFAAALGTFRLCRRLGWAVAPAAVAAAAYGFSPYVLSYLARLSVILAPWAAMPWMILLVLAAARTRSWRPAAAFAAVVLLVGSVNATSLVLAGLGPVVWLAVDLAARRVGVAATVRAAGSIALLSAAVSVWWIAGLRVQGTFGLPILDYTETYEAVAQASTPPEVVRGLGYWFFYGGDRLGPWVGPSRPYTNALPLMALGFALAGVSLAGFLRGFPGRAAAATTLLVGLAVSVGGAPLGDSTPFGRWFESFITGSTAGEALRSTPRAAPLVVLALALGLGSATSWVAARIGRPRLVPAIAIAAVVLQMFPWFTGRATTPALLRDENLPDYEHELASWLESTDTDRAYLVPGADFAHYRFGGTIDPVLPGLTDHPVLYRELVPQGSPALADLLNGLERRLADGWFEPESLPAIARLLDSRAVVLRNDLEYERFQLARPGPLWSDLTGILGAPDHRGPLIEDAPRIPMLDERALARPDAPDEFPAVAGFVLAEEASHDLGPVELVDARHPVVVAGSGDGLVDLAGAGLLDAAAPILYATTVEAMTADQRDAALGDAPWWILTDTNRDQGRRWSTLGSNLGAVEAGERIDLDPDLGDNRLDVFGDGRARPPGTTTRATYLGDVVDVRAGHYGNRVNYTVEDAPYQAVDGDPSTAWRAGVFDPTGGLTWELTLAEPAAPDEMTVLQPVTGAINRRITEIEVLLDGDSIGRFALDGRSRESPGQTLDLPGTPFEQLTIVVRADTAGPLSSYAGQPGVGFAEIDIPGVETERLLDLPDLPAGADADDRLTVVVTRERIDPATPNRTAPEDDLRRAVTLPEARRFSLAGEVRLSAEAPDDVLADALGLPSDAQADRRLPGSPASSGWAARDGDPTTAWRPPFDEARGATLTLPSASLATGDVVTLVWRDDAESSPPSRVVLGGDGGDGGDGGISADVGPGEPVGDGLRRAEIAVDRPLGPGTTLTIDEIVPRTTPEYFTGTPRELPPAIVDVELPGDDEPPIPSTVDTGCRDDLIEIDGSPVSVRVTGTVADALGRDELTLRGCGDVELPAGRHVITTTPGPTTGFDLDRLVLDTGPATVAGTGAGADTPPSDGSSDTLVEGGATAYAVDVAARETPIWVVLEQSHNDGWEAELDGIDLGPPVLVDGYANGWLLPAGSAGRLNLEWTPQRGVDAALLASVAAVLAVAGIVVIGGRRRRRAPTPPTPRRASSPLVAVAADVVAVATLGVVAGLAGAVGAAAIIAAVRLDRRAVRTSRLRRAPVLVAALVTVGLGVTGLGVTAIETVADYSDGPDWPSRFTWAAPFTWLAVAAVVTLAWRTSPRWWRSEDQ